VTITVVVCAYNEAVLLAPCLFSLLSQTRPPDEILVINNASTDETGAVARAVPGVRVVDEPLKGLVVAREVARRLAQSDILAYVDADCRAPIMWLERGTGIRAPNLDGGANRPVSLLRLGLTGRLLIRLYDLLVAPPTHALVHHAPGMERRYGGNCGAPGGSGPDRRFPDCTVEFHGETPISDGG
jgi:glycosyltransferase involved in cell wall biosynthesis